MKTPVKPGQRKFLLNMGYTEEEAKKIMDSIDLSVYE